jgi:hypothetical protein
LSAATVIVAAIAAAPIKPIVVAMFMMPLHWKTGYGPFDVQPRSRDDSRKQACFRDRAATKLWEG